MFLFTVHARELLNLRGHGLGLDVSRKSRIRSGGLMKRTHGVLFGKKGITDLFKHKECCCVVWGKRNTDLLLFTTIYMNEKTEHSINFVWMLFSW